MLTGVLSVGSGATKLRRGPSGGGARPYAWVEILVGAGVVLGASLGLARARPLAWVAVATAAVAVGLSSTAHVRDALREQERRAASEEARFRRFLEGPGRPATRKRR